MICIIFAEDKLHLGRIVQASLASSALDLHYLCRSKITFILSFIHMDCLKLRITKQVEMKWMLVLLLFIMAALPVSAAYSPAWYKTTADLRIRKGPSTSYDAVYTAPKGVEILVLEQMVTGWSKVVYVGDTLYAKSSYLSYFKPYQTTKKAVEKEDDFSWR